MQIVHRADGLPIGTMNSVAFSHPRCPGRAARLHPCHLDSRRLGQPEQSLVPPICADRLTSNAEIGAIDETSAHDLADDILCSVHRDRETDSLGRLNHRGVYPDDLSPRVNERSPEFPGLSETSVYMTFSMSRPDRFLSDLPRADTTPVDTVF